MHKKEVIGKGRGAGAVLTQSCREFEMGNNKSISPNRVASEWRRTRDEPAAAQGPCLKQLVVPINPKQCSQGADKATEKGPCLCDSLALLEPHVGSIQRSYNQSLF